MRQTSIAAIACLLAASATAEPRQVQIRSVDFQLGVVELFSFSASPESITGWRFCTHDEDQILEYSLAITGITLEPGASLFIHWNDDAPEGQEGRLNIADIGGGFAGPLDSGAFSIGLYFPGPDGFVNFGLPADLVDHIQWSIAGVDNSSADERSDEAQAAGLWTNQSLWIPTTSATLAITLTDTTGALLHGPANYQATEPPSPCPADTNADGILSPADFSAWIAAFNAQSPACDQNGDSLCTPADFSAWIAGFNAGC